MKLLITGANGHLGVRLLERLRVKGGYDVVAAVRSRRAAETVRETWKDTDVRIVDYRDPDQLREAGQDCDAIVHLVGVIKESGANSFKSAHEDACTALVAAKLPVKKIVCLGILGSSTDSPNSCLRSRANAEQILLSGNVPATIIRVPMVLGPGDYASQSLAKNGRSRFAFTFRKQSLEQPIYCEDLIDAIIATLALEPVHQILELAGPESLSREQLIHRAGALMSNRPAVISIPFVFGYTLAWLLERLSSNPPVTRAMLGVLDHDDFIVPDEAASLLDISLTTVDEMLAQVLNT
jgi:uncharacterized protein YbjT (DUF2867 family)